MDITTAAVVVFSDVCHLCSYTNDLCYREDPVHCNHYIQCFRQGSTIRAFRWGCPFGLFWNKTSLSCEYSLNVDCNVGTNIHWNLLCSDTTSLEGRLVLGSWV